MKKYFFELWQNGKAVDLVWVASDSVASAVEHLSAIFKGVFRLVAKCEDGHWKWIE